MALNLEEKKQVVADVKDALASTYSVIAADYRGLTVSEMNELRVNARSKGVWTRVVQNTLARRAFSDTPYECMHDSLVGPTLLCFSQQDLGSAAKIIKDFAKDHKALEVRAIALDGKLLSPDQLEAVAKLPTHDEALAMFMSTLQAPITQLVRTFAEPYARLARVLAQVSDNKQAA